MEARGKQLPKESGNSAYLRLVREFVTHPAVEPASGIAQDLRRTMPQRLERAPTGVDPLTESGQSPLPASTTDPPMLPRLILSLLLAAPLASAQPAQQRDQ